MNKKYIFVANWKMRIHFTHAINYCSENKQELEHVSNNHTLIICPSFVALPQIAQILHNTTVKIGAQDCSPFIEGSHTGQVSAISLNEIGCSYCIVGHSERRAQCNETNESVAEKVIRLLENDIIPIVCVGETGLDALNSRTYNVLKEQLEPIFITLQAHHKKNTPLLFTYEPTWAIGTGVIPQQSYLSDIFLWLKKAFARNFAEYKVLLLYGGSIDEKNIQQIAQISAIDGFLIGGASTEFSQLKKIITAASTPIL